MKADEPQVDHRHEDLDKNTILLFSLQDLEIFRQERRGQVKTILMERLNSILFHKSGLTKKQHTYQSINQYEELDLFDS